MAAALVVHMLLLALLGTVASLPPDDPFVPSWPPTYVMNQSTIIMPCNYSGATDPESTKGWAFLAYDWSNWKGRGKADGWVKHKPMDCEELLLRQVQMTTAVTPGQKIFVYRNMPKALPWYTVVRTKITDPAYAPWFLKFSPAILANHSLSHVPVCDHNYRPPLCSDLYHDQSQTPGYPHGDGDCAPPACDVGAVPVGEYLFDPRNANTFIDWFVNDYFFGPTGAGNPNISGFYIDDDWGEMNPNGPSEMEAHAVQDLGLSKRDLQDIIRAYRWVAETVYRAIVGRGKFAWNLFLNNDPNCAACGDCPQPWVRRQICAADLRRHCHAAAPVQTRALLYGFSPGSCKGTDPRHLTELQQDLANFLLIRGPYAYLGNGWSGCSVAYPYPAQHFNADYGTPTEICRETAPNSGIFTREWTKAKVQMDCNTWTPTIAWKSVAE